MLPNIHSVLNLTILVLLVAVLYQGDYFTPTYPAVHSNGIIIITGASTGIGQHAAAFLADKGFYVLAGVRKQSDYDSLLSVNTGSDSKGRSNTKTRNLHPILVDVTSSESISTAVDYVKHLTQSLDLPLVALVNNAGIALLQTPIEMTEQSDIKRVFNTNVFGAVEMTKQFLPLLRESKGRIIMMSSLAGMIAGPMTSTYAASKYALEAFSDSLRREITPQEISVSIIEPGYVKSNIANHYILDSSKSYGIYAEMQQTAYDEDKSGVEKGDDPIVSSEAIYDAITNLKPKTRYLCGKLNKSIYFFTSVLTDRYLDKLMTTPFLGWLDFCVGMKHCPP